MSTTAATKTIQQQIEELRGLPVSRLRERYAEVFGEGRDGRRRRAEGYWRRPDPCPAAAPAVRALRPGRLCARRSAQHPAPTTFNRRSHEPVNNSYAKGIVLTLANDTVGTGPRLQMLTPDAAANRRVEELFELWAEAIDLPGKLRTMRMARAESGEAFGVLVSSPGLDSPVKLDLRLLEPEQVATPWRAGAPLPEGEVDGIVLDAHGLPVAYRVLRHHPGDAHGWPGAADAFDTLPASSVLHYFRPDRPGQVRGVPDITPALPLFAQLRRYTLAVIAAAETAADFAAVLYTEAPANGEADPLEPMDEVELEKRMATVLPGGWKLGQVHAEQPTTSYAEFKREILNEIARCLNMPFNVAAGNSSGYNYASGRLDHQTYFKSLRVDQLLALGAALAGAAAAAGLLAGVISGVGAAVGLVIAAVGALLSPVGLVIAAVLGLAGALLVASDAGGEALEWLGEQFTRLRDWAAKAIGRIADALSAGDIELAAQILWLSLRLIWQQGVAALSTAWLEAKRLFLGTAQSMWHGALAAAEIGFHALEVAWIETTAFLARTWTDFTTSFQMIWEGATAWVAKRMLEIQGLFDSGLDVGAAKGAVDRQLQSRLAELEEAAQRTAAARERRRAQEREQAAAVHEATLAAIGQDFETAQDALRRDTEAGLAESRAALDAAKERLAAAIEEARRKREAADAERGSRPARSPRDLVAEFEDRLTGLGDLLARGVSVRGTFNARATQGLAADSGAAERTAKATEQTAKHTKRLADAAQTGGLTFA